MRRRERIRKQAETRKSVALPGTLTRGVARKQISLLCSEIAREFHPERIVLFGSHAYGNPRAGSDVDLLIVMPFEGSPFRQAAVILGHLVQAVGVVPLDMLVRTPHQVQARIQMGDSFMREIIERGRVMYEADSEGTIH